MRSHPYLLCLGALAIAGCAQAPTPSPERTGAASEKSLTLGPAPAAIRFLEQATFGPTPADVTTVTSDGIPAYLASQLTVAPTFYASNYYTVAFAASLADVPASCT